ncbi:MAG: hypothetical protein WC364_11985 [Eubacteriales bacterium]
MLASIIGTTKEDIVNSVNKLTAPDPNSKNPANEGRRLIHQTGYLYFVVSHENYRAIKNNQERREYMRNYMKLKREKDSVNKLTDLTKVNPASAYASESSLKRDIKGDGFDLFWGIYPKKVGKGAARKAWEKKKCNTIKENIMEAVKNQREWEQWVKEEGQFIPHPSTWINEERWNDEGMEKINNTNNINKRLAETERKMKEALQ